MNAPQLDVIDAQQGGATIVTPDGQSHHAPWPALRQAATAQTFPATGWLVAGQPDHVTRAIFRVALSNARAVLRQQPIYAQGLQVHLWSPTSGATWRVTVTDTSGASRHELLLPDEQLDAPTRELSLKTAIDASRRMRCDLVQWPVGKAPLCDLPA